MTFGSSGLFRCYQRVTDFTRFQRGNTASVVLTTDLLNFPNWVSKLLWYCSICICSPESRSQKPDNIWPWSARLSPLTNYMDWAIKAIVHPNWFISSWRLIKVRREDRDVILTRRTSHSTRGKCWGHCNCINVEPQENILKWPRSYDKVDLSPHICLTPPSTG